MRLRAGAALWGIVLLAQAAAAQDPALRATLSPGVQACAEAVCIPGRYEFRYLHLSEFQVDAAGAGHGDQHVGVQRWRLQPRINVTPDLFVSIEADLVTGRVFADTGELTAWSAPRWEDFRGAWLQWSTPIGVLRAGHQTTHAGLGLVANAGDDTGRDGFDDPTFGDIVERLLFATRPLAFLDEPAAEHIVLAGGVDLIFRDEHARLADGDLAFQGVVTLGWRSETLEAGAYLAFRRQRERDTNTWDLFARWTYLAPGLRLTLGAEGALVTGTAGGARLRGVGAVALAHAVLTEVGLDLRLEGGYASGDDRADDGVDQSFHFDRAYHVGMLLFREVLARRGDRAGEGAITDAGYVYPVARFVAPFGMSWALAALPAWTARGAYLGTEVDAGVGYALTVRQSLRLAFGVQGAVFLPGRGLAGPPLGAVGKVRTTFDMGW